MGESTFSMNYEFNLLSVGTNLQLSGGESFPMIDDEPVEKEIVEKKKNFFERFVENIKPSGLLVSAIFGVIAVAASVVAAPLTGVAAVVVGAVAVGAAVAGAVTEAYTYATAFVDTVTGRKTDDAVFLDNVLEIGAITFVLAGGIAALPGLAAAGGIGGGALALEGVGAVALEGGLVISVEGVIAGALEVVVGGTLTGAIALAASMGGGDGNTYSRYIPKGWQVKHEQKSFKEIQKENGWELGEIKKNASNERKAEIKDASGNKIGDLHLGHKVKVNGKNKVVQDHYHLDSEKRAGNNIHHLLPDKK